MGLKDLKSKLLTRSRNSFTAEEHAAAAASPISPLRKSIDIKYQAETEGTFSFRALAFVGGVAVIFTSFLSIILSILQAKVLQTFLYSWCVLFGVLICILEGTFLREQIDCFSAIEQRITKYLPFLNYLWGRGVLYIFAGTFQASHYSPMNLFSGIFLITVGILFVLIGLRTKSRLARLKEMLHDDKVLKREFKRFDKDRDGVLSKVEFGDLVSSLTGFDMNDDDIDAAFGVIDKDRNGAITMEEFRIWWIGFQAPDGNEDPLEDMA